MNIRHFCPACVSGELEQFFEIRSVPTNSCILLESREEALEYPQGDIRLGFCPSCGFISNVAFDRALTEYSGRYEETQSFSQTFRTFHGALAQKLIERYGLRGKRVLEIGCGKGEFLTLLSELGNNTGTGFDPAYHEDRNASPAAANLTFIKSFYSEEYADHQTDFVCCKMTLEHIPAVSEFVSNVRRTIGDNHETVVFFQIPEASRIFRDCAIEDIYYEHCSYFSPGSLARLFRRCDFQVLRMEVEYGGQYLTIEARPGNGQAPDPSPLEDDLNSMRLYVEEFPAKARLVQETWRKRLSGLLGAGRKTVLWGSGSKAVSLLTTLDLDERLQYVVDINPYRQGHYMPKTGQEIVGPDFLVEYQPDVVVVMNRMYIEEIGRDLESKGLKPELIAL